MKSKLILPSLLLGLITLVFSCKKDQKTSSKTIAPPSAVYISGAIGGDAIYWKNGTAVTLPEPTPSVNIQYKNEIADALFISGDDVYFAGMGATSKGLDTPVYWKNGTLNFLPELPGAGASNYAIGVIGNDVYCAGGIYPANNLAGVIWKNGVPSRFGGRQTVVNSITVNNGDLYTSGTDQVGSNGSIIATYYKNRQKVLLNSNGMTAAAFEVAVSGSDIYVAGFVTPIWSKFSAA